MRNHRQLILALSISALALFASHSYCFPLSANKRWIIDAATGQRVKLKCANWPGHMSLMLAEGLDKQPIRNIVSQLPKLGLNCVRLTWATYMYTRYSNRTIEQTLNALGLAGAKMGIINNNPNILNMTHLQAYAFVVDELGAHNIMVVSDNHISEPKWCCASDDGNAFFGDKSFDPKEWLQGLSMAAQLLKSKPQVVGISLRNELRGPLQNLDGWYRNVTQGALMVHQANPNALVIISGLYNDNDLGFLRVNPLNLTLNGKLVYEVHTYPFSGERKDWSMQSANHLCGKVRQELDNKAGFLTTGPNPSPLLVSEFGIDLISKTEADERWLTCVLSYLAEADLDWAWWGLQGSYYLREGRVNTGESYGLLTFQWNQPSYEQFPHRFQFVLNKLQDPSSKLGMSNIFYHPQSGECVKRNEQNEVEVSDCSQANRWSEEGAQIKVKGQEAECLKAAGEGLPVTLSTDCSSNQSSWKAISKSGMHLATVDGEGNNLCLQKDGNSSRILTNKCICVDDNPGCIANPQSQWFRLVSTNV